MRRHLLLFPNTLPSVRLFLLLHPWLETTSDGCEDNLKKLSETSFDLGEFDPHIYIQLIGSLMYLVNTRPDICYAVSVLNQFMSQPRQTHWIVAKHVLRYLRGTIGYGLRYASSVDMRLEGYANAD
jgi:hypothetical protein